LDGCTNVAVDDLLEGEVVPLGWISQHTLVLVSFDHQLSANCILGGYHRLLCATSSVELAKEEEEEEDEQGSWCQGKAFPC